MTRVRGRMRGLALVSSDENHCSCRTGVTCIGMMAPMAVNIIVSHIALGAGGDEVAIGSGSVARCSSWIFLLNARSFKGASGQHPKLGEV